MLCNIGSGFIIVGKKRVFVRLKALTAVFLKNQLFRDTKRCRCLQCRQMVTIYQSTHHQVLGVLNYRVNNPLGTVKILCLR